MKSNNRRKTLLITGCGRSGTRYMAALLSKHGFDIQHERIGRDGIASWCMAVDSDRTPWGPPRKHYVFENTFHQIRNPLNAIPSIASFKSKSWEYVCKWIPCSLGDPPLLRAAKYWYYWNIEAETISEWRYCIEDIQLIYVTLCGKLALCFQIR